MTKLLIVIIGIVVASTQVAAEDLPLCDQLFSQLKTNEPLLATELDDLNHLCKLDVAQSGPGYWICVNEFLDRRGHTSDNLILSGHLCDGVESEALAKKY